MIQSPEKHRRNPGAPERTRTSNPQIRSLPGNGASAGVTAHWDPGVSREAARALLVAVSTGDPVPGELVTSLVEAVLGAPLFAMALQAREPGPHQIMAALRLAAAVCEASRAWETMVGGEGVGP